MTTGPRLDGTRAAEAAGPRPSRRRWFRKRGIDLGDLAVETFAVILGILIALGINSLSTDRQNRQKIEQARSAIRLELDAHR